MRLLLDTRNWRINLYCRMWRGCWRRILIRGNIGHSEIRSVDRSFTKITVYFTVNNFHEFVSVCNSSFILHYRYWISGVVTPETFSLFFAETFISFAIFRSNALLEFFVKKLLFLRPRFSQWLLQNQSSMVLR